ncbi:hypothetical protein SK128_018302 [Halocaridina rubra]|uniref:Uncharacterized protein n=1 Tax=Halocaridina rubra TaxID=373956 RepID=A0AAN9AG06_HALRR
MIIITPYDADLNLNCGTYIKFCKKKVKKLYEKIEAIGSGSSHLKPWPTGFSRGPFINKVVDRQIKPRFTNPMFSHFFLRLKKTLLLFLSALSRIVQHSMPYNKITKPFSKDYYVK